MTARWLVGEAVDRNLLRSRRTGPRLFGLPRPGRPTVSAGCGRVPLPFHRCLREDLLVGSFRLFLQVEDRAFPRLGVGSQLQPWPRTPISSQMLASFILSMYAVFATQAYGYSSLS